MIAIVLAGGSKSLVNELYPVAGEPFLYWLTLWLKTQGCHHIVFSVYHHADKVTAFVQQMATLQQKLCLDVVIEPRPLGTAGAAAFCAKRFPSQFHFIVNGDSLFLTNIRYPLSKLKKHAKPDAIIFETHQANTGVYLIRNELLNEVSIEKESSLERDYFPRWLKEKQIEVISADHPFLKIDSPKSRLHVEDFIEKHQHMFMTDEEFCHI